MVEALGSCFVLQRTFGKQGDNLGKTASLFAKMLSHHEPMKVIEAIGQWIVRGGSDFPTPFDIEQILSPKPKADYRLYSRLLKKFEENRYSITKKERAYLNWYEKECMDGLDVDDGDSSYIQRPYI